MWLVILLKTVYDEFVKKINGIHAIGTSKLVRKTDYDTKIKGREKNLDQDKLVLL